MKKLLLIIITITSAFATPAWYQQLNDTQENYYIGYGQARSDKKARDLALDDIASQISTTVDNSLQQSTSVNNDAVQTNIKKRSSHKSYAKLQGYKKLNYTVENGIHYIALSYENIPSLDKFNRKLSKLSRSENEQQNPYLANTPMAKKLIKKIDFSLLRKDKLWYIHYRDIFQSLDNNDFSKFFASQKSGELSIRTHNNHSVLHDGENFFFKIHSAKSGFITLFTVYEDGTVATLMRNVAVDSHSNINVPNQENSSIFQAGLIAEGKETFDLYIVLFTPQEHYFDNFAQADEALISDERYKNFDELIELFREYPFTTLKVITKPQ